MQMLARIFSLNIACSVKKRYNWDLGGMGVLLHDSRSVVLELVCKLFLGVSFMCDRIFQSRILHASGRWLSSICMSWK